MPALKLSRSVQRQTPTSSVRQSVASALGALLLTLSAQSAVAGDAPELKQTRICDKSGCYLAWEVIDSDDDGIVDADELVAGTNPHDPLSRPSLSYLLKLAENGQLPSFEKGLGGFFVFPTELQAALEKNNSTESAMSAFPLSPGRTRTLESFGISFELIKDHGIDPSQQGLSIGLGLGAKDQVPEVVLVGIQWNLVAADGSSSPKNKEDQEPLVPIPPPPHDNHGYKTSGGPNWTGYQDGCVRHDYPDGGSKTKDKDGNTVGRTYVNPDADPATAAPTPEQEERLLRLRNSAIRTVDGWAHADLGGATVSDPWQTVILTDPESFGDIAVVFSDLRIGTAQPESRPDLPSPQLPAGAGAGSAPGTNDCTKGCPTTSG